VAKKWSGARNGCRCLRAVRIFRFDQPLLARRCLPACRRGFFGLMMPHQKATDSDCGILTFEASYTAQLDVSARRYFNCMRRKISEPGVNVVDCSLTAAPPRRAATEPRALGGRVCALPGCLLAALLWLLPAPLTEAAANKIDFVRDIQPILAKRCYECHGATRQKGELRWDLKSAALKGGASGPAIVPGKSAESRLIQLVSGLKEDLVMPQKGERLTGEQIGLLRAWIDQGANWPDGVDSVKPVDKRDHWAFKAPVSSAEPAVKNRKWVRNPIDSFVLARLESQKLSPSPEADRVTLIRRLSLDLIGLPPSIDEVKQFLTDKNRDAYERLVERLLASPH